MIPTRFAATKLMTAFAFVAMTACAAPQGGTDVGDVTFALSLPSGASIDSVACTIHAGAPTGIVDRTATIDTHDPRATASIAISFPASSGDTVTLTATTSSGISCQGVSAPFDVTPGQVARVVVLLACGEPPSAPAGAVSVIGQVSEQDACPTLTAFDVSPLETSVGSFIDVSAVATDATLPADGLTYAWSPASAFVDPTARVTEFFCLTDGALTLTLTVSDNHLPTPCTVSTSVDVTCVGIDSHGNFCGDGIVGSHEQCDGTPGCDPATCQFSPPSTPP